MGGDLPLMMGSRIKVDFAYTIEVLLLLLLLQASIGVN